MSTVFKDKNGKVLKTESGTKYHQDGTGPRDEHGRRLVIDRPVEQDTPSNTGADAQKGDK